MVKREISVPMLRQIDLRFQDYVVLKEVIYGLVSLNKENQISAKIKAKHLIFDYY